MCRNKKHLKFKYVELFVLIPIGEISRRRVRREPHPGQVGHSPGGQPGAPPSGGVALILGEPRKHIRSFEAFTIRRLRACVGIVIIFHVRYCSQRREKRSVRANKVNIKQLEWPQLGNLPNVSFSFTLSPSMTSRASIRMLKKSTGFCAYFRFAFQFFKVAVPLSSSTNSTTYFYTMNTVIVTFVRIRFFT